MKIQTAQSFLFKNALIAILNSIFMSTVYDRAPNFDPEHQEPIYMGRLLKSIGFKTL